MNNRYFLCQWTSVADLASTILMIAFASHAIAQEVPGGCGSLQKNNVGPVDYRAAQDAFDSADGSAKRLLQLTERDHFTREAASLRRGPSGGTAGPDIAYTLRVFPNHHRALLAMAALGEKEKTDQPVGSSFTVECWFRRAVAFRPDDNLARMLYAQFLIKAKRHTDAEFELEVAQRQAGDNAFTQHNIGLLYFDMKNYDKALSQAGKAYQLGLVSPLLKEKLKSVNKWSEPVPAAPVDTTASPQ